MQTLLRKYSEYAVLCKNSCIILQILYQFTYLQYAEKFADIFTPIFYCEYIRLFNKLDICRNKQKEKNMTSEYQKTQQKIQEISKENEDKELRRLVNLSQKNIPIAIFLSIFIPFGAYIYTKRFLPFVLFMLGGFVFLSVFSSEAEEPKYFENAVIYGAVVASADNGIAISRARQRLKDLSRS